MASLNRVELIGNLGRDPEIRSLQNGNKVASLNLATSEKWTDKHSGERREKTEWHRISVFNEHLVPVVEKYLRKGSKIFISGQLQTRKWQDQGGQDRYTTEIVLQNFRGELVMLDGRDQPGGAGDEPDGNSYGQNSGGRTPAQAQGTNVDRPYSGGGGAAPMGADLDDDIPF